VRPRFGHLLVVCRVDPKGGRADQMVISPHFRFTSPVPGPVAERRLRGCCGESCLVGAFDFCRFD
jgi:hypothetical protein